MRKPVLVVHGIANHDKQDFFDRVKTLNDSIHPNLPDVDLIPVYWADLAGKSNDLSDSLPILKNGEWTTRAEEAPSMTVVSEIAVRSGLSNEERAAIISSSSEVRATDELKEALDETTYIQKIDDPETLRAIGKLLDAEATTEDSDDEEQYLVRGEMEVTRSWVGDRLKGVIKGLDKVVGKMLEDRLGVWNQNLRSAIATQVAITLGDIVAYQANTVGIQKRMWDAIAAHAPGYGTPANPISVIAHSLGGVVAFDAAASPASGTQLCIDSFISFGSQPAFFQIVAPRPGLTTYSKDNPITLPGSIKRWFNMWDVADLLAFTAGTVFRLSDGKTPEDIVVQDSLSTMFDEKFWLHSVYWNTQDLLNLLKRALA